MRTTTSKNPRTTTVLNKIFKKIFYYISSLTIILGSALGIMNSANAASLTLTADSAQGTNGINGSATLAAADNVNLSTFTLTISEALDLSGGDGIDEVTGTTGTLTFTLGSGADTASFESFITSPLFLKR